MMRYWLVLLVLSLAACGDDGDAAGQPLTQGPVSTGQDALVQAAGPTAGADVRAKVDDNSGLVYPSPGFVDRVMNWTVPPGYQSLVTKASKGWFSGWF
jgi:hypothetical protein